MREVSREEILAAGPWWQKITFPCGLTVGEWETDKMLAALTAGVVLQGKRALEIGCMSGVGTLWLERMGAEVWAFDREPECGKQFAIVRAAFGMEAEFRCEDIYYAALGRRDVVAMTGVYYHLEHPLLGLERAWRMAGEVLLVEGEVVEGDETTALFCAGEYKGDGSNWWVPTVPCLMAWLGWLPGEKRIVDVTPEGYLPNRRLVQVWRA